MQQLIDVAQGVKKGGEGITWREVVSKDLQSCRSKYANLIKNKMKGSKRSIGL